MVTKDHIEQLFREYFRAMFHEAYLYLHNEDEAMDIVQNNEYMYLTGNPDLRNWRNLTSNFAYNYYKDNKFSMAAFAGYNRDFNRVATIYTPFDNGQALLREFINNGSYRNYYFGVALNLKLLSNNLQLYANLTQNAYEITGDYPGTLYPFRAQMSGTYYWKAFNVLASWGMASRTLTENSNYTIRGRNFHMLSMGWSNGSWALNLAFKNIFNRGWRQSTWSSKTPRYEDRKTVYDPSAHASVKLSATYTIGYGKKIQRNNEARAEGAASSAIVK